MSSIDLAPKVSWNRQTLADGNLFAEEFNNVYNALNAIIQAEAERAIGTFVISATKLEEPDFLWPDGRILQEEEWPILFKKIEHLYASIRHFDQFNQDLTIELPITDLTEGQFRIPYVVGLSPSCINEGSSGFNANGLLGILNGDKTRNVTGVFHANCQGSYSGPFVRGNCGGGISSGSSVAGYTQATFDWSRSHPTGTNGTAPSFNCYMYIRAAYTVPGFGTIK